MNILCQYAFVKSSRAVLLDYCARLTQAHFVTDHSSFGRGSVRNLLVHVGNTYEFWLGKQALKKDVIFRTYDSVNNVPEVADYFLIIDKLVETFAAVYAEKLMQDIEINIGGKMLPASPLKLFTHVITHEFHHKGQILSLSRHLGYVPVDTDVIR